MKTYRIHTSLAVILTGIGIHAQTMTLSQCLDEGLQNNYQIRLSRISEEVAANNDTWANAGGMTTLDLTGGYDGSMYDRNMTDRQTGDVSSTRGVVDHTLSAQIAANWTIFNGFKVQSTLDRLQELHRQGETRTRMAVEDFVADIASGYYNYVRQQLRRQNLNYAVALSRERLRIVQERYAIGSNSRLDLQQAQVDFNSDSARSMKQNEAVRSALIELNQLMSREELTEFFAAADTSIDLLPVQSYQTLEELMLQSNLDLLQAESNSRISELDLKAARARNYPYLRLHASYGFTHNIYGSGTSSTRDNWGPGFGATVGINLLDGKHKTETRNAKLNIESARLNRQNLELALRSDLTDLWQSYENNLQLVDLEQQNLLTAKENHAIACERYMIGDLSGLQMREAQKSLLDAEESLLQAQYDTKICEISLFQISGQILQYLEGE
ncbi:MAG: TolC family protein [Bacteroidaceae bacterium]|nr:TolC family protein [Bacteroidaceae bacterium]